MQRCTPAPSSRCHRWPGTFSRPNSRTGKTDALPAIWEQPEKFKQALTAFQTAAAALAKAADGEPRALAAPVGDLAKACKACHDDFRKKD